MNLNKRWIRTFLQGTSSLSRRQNNARADLPVEHGHEDFDEEEYT
jgi:hypothetical protein